jgi:hypothetical protein
LPKFLSYSFDRDIQVYFNSEILIHKKIALHISETGLSLVIMQSH